MSLPSGRCETVSVLQCGSVADLKIAAQQALGQRFLRLAAPDGRLLNKTELLQDSGFRDGGSIAAVAQQPKIAATKSAFALWCVRGDRVVTWGNPQFGVQDPLNGVQQIFATDYAFAAILTDGSVVTWGSPTFGGDSTAVQGQLNNVQQISATKGAFAAILTDGSVVTWGNPGFGGDSSAVQHQLKGVQQIYASDNAFAAISADGNVMTWGDRYSGGDSSRVQDQFSYV